MNADPTTDGERLDRLSVEIREISAMVAALIARLDARCEPGPEPGQPDPTVDGWPLCINCGTNRASPKPEPHTGLCKACIAENRRGPSR